MSPDRSPAKTAFILNEEQVKKIDDAVEKNPSLLATIILEAQQGIQVSLEYLTRSKYDSHGAEGIAVSPSGQITAESGVLVTFAPDEHGGLGEIDTIVNVRN